MSLLTSLFGIILSVVCVILVVSLMLMIFAMLRVSSKADDAFVNSLENTFDQSEIDQ